MTHTTQMCGIEARLAALISVWGGRVAPGHEPRSVASPTCHLHTAGTRPHAPCNFAHGGACGTVSSQMTKAADIIVKNTAVGRKISNELAKDINVVSSTVSDVKSATVGAAQKMDKALDRALDNVIEVAIDEGDHGDPDGTTVQESLSTSTNRRISNFNGEFGGGESASEALLRCRRCDSTRKLSKPRAACRGTLDATVSPQPSQLRPGEAD